MVDRKASNQFYTRVDAGGAEGNPTRNRRNSFDTADRSVCSTRSTCATSPYLSSSAGHHERRNLSAAGRDVGEAGRAEACQKPGEPAAEDVRRKVDEHVAHARRRRSRRSETPRAGRRSSPAPPSRDRVPPARSTARRPIRASVVSQPSVTPVPPYSSFGLMTKRSRCAAQVREEIDRLAVARDAPLLERAPSTGRDGGSARAPRR